MDGLDGCADGCFSGLGEGITELGGCADGCLSPFLEGLFNIFFSTGRASSIANRQSFSVPGEPNEGDNPDE